MSAVIELGPESRAWLENLVRDQTALLARALNGAGMVAPQPTQPPRMFADPPARPAARAAPATSGPLPTVFPNYGRSKGAPIAGATEQDLEYYGAGARRSIADPSKGRFHAKERALLAAIDEELSRQGGSGGAFEPPPAFDEPPRAGAPSDDDIPF